MNLTVMTGWTLIHFIWQGALVALVTAAGLRLARDAAANTRYLIACAGLSAMLIAPVVTAIQVLQSATTFTDPTPPSVLVSERTADAAAAEDVVAAAPEAAATGVRSGTWLAIVVWGWLAGVCVLMARLAGGCWRVHRIRTASLAEGPSRWQSAAGRIATRLRVDVAFRVVESRLVEAPSAIGWMKPLIVLPVAALGNLSPAQIEAILAHELAHIRRRDYAINVLQTVAESLLFYHPGVWWVSGRIREEREHCCDDAAVSVCGEPAAYAAALVEIASWRSRIARPAVAVAAGSLVVRVRRLMGIPQDTHPRPITGVTVVALGVVLFAGGVLRSSWAQEPGPDWRTYNTDHFQIHYQPDRDLHAERVGREAERAYERVSADLRHNLASRIPVILFRTRTELERGAQMMQPAGPAHASGSGPSRDRILLALDPPADQWYGLITHEVAHVFGFDIIPGTATPAWVVEGLAEYERGTWDPEDLVTLRERVRAGTMPGIDELGAGAGGGDRAIHAVGHAAFDFIESRWGKQGVRQFLFGLRQAALKGADAYQHAFQMSRDAFGDALRGYLTERFAALPPA